MPMIMKDQERARRAYGLVTNVEDKQDDYKIAMNGLGANIIRLGLSAALAELQRRGGKGGDQALDHLAAVLNEVNLPGLGNALKRDNLVNRINRLGAQDYMLVTRELMAQISWFRRAMQAIF